MNKTRWIAIMLGVGGIAYLVPGLFALEGGDGWAFHGSTSRAGIPAGTAIIIGVVLIILSFAAWGSSGQKKAERMSGNQKSRTSHRSQRGAGAPRG